ncbi:MAG: hypothetical protein DRJ01_01115 [Bacteroidetes bacterium]|nr:MAG: hypothetical protein DRJ01_01115 [Bacteroidota bacterium]
MNKQNTEKLFERFNFFRPELPITESLMAFGFECGDGWFDIIWDLCEKIEPLVDEEFNVFQVKEKFGGLRFYVDGSSDIVYDLITEAEDKAEVTCEVCGKPGKSRGGGWIRTLCDECNK